MTLLTLIILLKALSPHITILGLGLQHTDVCVLWERGASVTLLFSAKLITKLM